MFELKTDLIEAATALRRAIHHNPELGYQETETTDAVATALDVPGITLTRRTGTGLIADVGSAGKRVAFRADLDALPIHELTDVAFASKTPGVMHACGHDAHTAIGVTIAKHLARMELPGRVRFIFQPAEESFPGGAQLLVNEDILDDVSAILAFHVDPSLEVGKVGLKAGAITSSSDRFEIMLSGPGGHTARPHETVDLLHAAGRMLTDLPAQFARSIDARIPVAMVFGQIAGGSADNVIPTEVRMSGTCRVLDEPTWQSIPERLERLVQAIVSPTGAIAKLTYSRGIAPVVNDPATLATAGAAIEGELGAGSTVGTDASMGAEDFSSYLQMIPGALLRLGAWDGVSVKTALHSAFFTIDERAIETGVRAGAASLLALLSAE
ncbi:MAG: amidohydrolase [Acidimicrobiia bacterium]|nr:amidohydrolase [Acidimicrobiia bacterium]